MSKILLIRHGQASYGAANYDQLSDLGYEQGYILGQHLAEEGIRPTSIFVGPLQRHLQTYEQIRKGLAEKSIECPEPVFTDNLNEHYGPQVFNDIKADLIMTNEYMAECNAILERDPTQRIKQGLKIFAKFLELWCSGELAHLHPEQYQDWKAFTEQATAGFNELLKVAVAQKSSTILAVTSGGTKSAIIGHLLGMTDQKRISKFANALHNTSVTRVYTNDRGASLISFNEVHQFVDHKYRTLI